MQIERIESRDNRRLVHARKVRDGRVPGSIFIEGGRLAEEAVTSGIEIDQCFVTDEWTEGEVVNECLHNGVLVGLLTDKLFRSISDTDNPQGMLLIGKRAAASLTLVRQALQSASLPGIIYLSQVNNPSNLGAVVRAAEAAGAAGLILSPGSADPFSPKALRASMGSAFRLPIVERVHMEEALHWAGEDGLNTLATAAKGERSYLEIDWTMPWMLILGSEAHGLSSTEISDANQIIRIPMSERVESLNLAVSAGILLFEAKRQTNL